MRSSDVLDRRAPPAVEWVKVQGEVVAWRAEREELHRLGPLLALVFQLVDGEGTLLDIIDELVEELENESSVVSTMVLRAAVRLLELDLVTVVQARTLIS